METKKPTRKRRLKRFIIIFLSIVIVLVVLVIAFISPITKYVIEKYDEKYLGRKITLDWAYVNPFTGYVYLRNVKVYERDNDSVFFSSHGIGANVTIYKLFSNTYEISSLTLTEPRGTIIQKDTTFNFDDIIAKLTETEDKVPEKKVEKTRFSVLDVTIDDGKFYYREESIPINYSIKKVNIQSSGLRWDADTVATDFSFVSGIGTGNIKGHNTVNLKELRYNLSVVVRNFSMELMEQYMKDLSHYGTLRAKLNADFKSRGSFVEETDMTSSGKIAVNNFHIGKTPEKDYASFDKLVVSIKEVSPANHVYEYDSVSLLRPYFIYEKYDSLDNIQTMFGEGGSKVKAADANPQKFNLILELADYLREIVKNFFKSDYNVGRLAVYKANFRYNDFSTSEKFAVACNPLTLIADSIDRTREQVRMVCNSGIHPYGYFSVRLDVHPRNNMDFKLYYNLKNVPLAMFNPYTVTYTSFPLDRGKLELNGSWTVGGGMINSYNHLLIIDPRTSKRIRNKDTRWIPMPLILSLTRERGNVIDYEIPITGDLRDPDFHWKDPILDFVKNLFIKPPTTPYGMEVRNIETKIEKSLALKWKICDSDLTQGQKKAVRRIASFLKDNPNASITITPRLYAEKEQEYILFYRAKKKYFMTVNGSSFSRADSMRVVKMSVKEPPFLKYLDKMANNKLMFTSQEKCSVFVTPGQVQTEYARLNEERKRVFMQFFKEEGVEKQVKITGNQYVIPFNGFSFYKIAYNGELPESLVEGWDKLNDLNEKPPRDKYRNNRKRASK